MRGEIYENWLCKKVSDPQGFPQVLRICPPPSPYMGALQTLRRGAYVNTWGSMGRGALNAAKKYLWKSSFNSKVANYKPASLQIY